MKKWICYGCGRRGETEDNVIIKICNCCQEEMEELKKEGKNGKGES